MTEPPSGTPEPSPAPPKPPAEGHGFEMAAVFSLAVACPLYWAIHAFIRGGAHTESHIESLLYLLVSSVSTIVPLLYLLHRSREGLAHFGVTRPKALPDLGGGVFLALLLIGTFLVFWRVILLNVPPYLLTELWMQPKSEPAPRDPAGVVLFLAAHAANAFLEELAMRCYFVTRIRERTGSWLTGVLYGAALFASYHIYQGVVPVIDIFFFGVVLGFAYILVRRIWPLALAHLLFNCWLTYFPFH